jgi:hypothetical protein
MTFLKLIHGIDQKQASRTFLEVILTSAILGGRYVTITVNWVVMDGTLFFILFLLLR